MYSFENDYRIVHILQYAEGGELYEHLRREHYFKEPRARFYTAEITAALFYLHQKRIVYRDLKLENILLDREGHILLTDFGLGKMFNKNSNSKLSTLCGTPEYMAPEIIDDECKYFRKLLKNLKNKTISILKFFYVMKRA